MRKYLISFVAVLLASCASPPEFWTDTFTEVITKGSLHEDSSCCMGGHAAIHFDLNGETFIVCHSHGEAYQMGDLIGGPIQENRMVAPKYAVLLEPRYEQLLIKRLSKSTLGNRESLIAAIQRFSKTKKESANKAIQATPQ